MALILAFKEALQYWALFLF